MKDTTSAADPIHAKKDNTSAACYSFTKEDWDRIDAGMMSARAASDARLNAVLASPAWNDIDSEEFRNNDAAFRKKELRR